MTSPMKEAYERSGRSRKHHYFCLASWLLQSKRTTEIDKVYLPRWPHLQPYLRLILISHNVKKSAVDMPDRDFLDFWKDAIAFVGLDAVSVSPEQVEQATDETDVPLKGLDEIKTIMNRQSPPDRKLLALITSIYHPEWGKIVCDEFRINIGNSELLGREHYPIYIGLLYTYNGFK